MSNARSSPTPNAQIHRLSEQLHELESGLRAQQDLLRRRGMSLPVGLLDRMHFVRADLERLASSFVSDDVELGQLRALAQTLQLINSSLEPVEVLNEVMDTAIALTGAERGYIMLYSSRTGELEFRVARDNRHETILGEHFTVSDTIVAQVAQTGQPVVARDAMLDSFYATKESIVFHAPRSVICVPLIFKGRVTGALYADNRRVPDLFGDQELSLLMAFANQAAVAIENARLFERARRALAEITEMKDLLNNVLASIASAVITTDNHRAIVTYNPAAERILGIPQAEALGQHLDDLLPDVFAPFTDTMQTVRLYDRQQVLELESVLPGRGAVNLNVKLTPLKDAHGLTYGMAVVVDDLTEIKKRDATLNVVRTYLPPSLVRNIESIDGLGLSGDEREVSILFADVRGFTTFSEQLDPQQLMEIISRYLTVSTDAIQFFDGIIDKYMGDAVVGLFNTQLNPQSDHAVRAVRAAMAMAYDIRALHEVLAPDQRLFYGIGVDTGTAMLGNVGSPSRKEFTAIGRPFNFAKLLQENALAGEIIISANTYELVREIVTVEALEPRKAKGYADFQVMYRVTGIARNSSQD